MAIAPWVFHTKKFRQSPFSSILFKDFIGAVITRIRLEVLFTCVLWVVMWQLLDLRWESVGILYACFAFNWATRQYVTHAWTPRDVIEGAANLQVSRWMGLILLNGQWDHAHHKFPYLPWTELSNPSYHQVATRSYFKQWLSLWKGMRPNNEKAPAVLEKFELENNIHYT